MINSKRQLNRDARHAVQSVLEELGILDRFGVGHFDGAGNCRLRSPRHRLLIDRRGRKAPPRLQKGAANPFSPKSSRIVRALLGEPTKGWMVRELAEYADVNVNPALGI